MTKTDKFCGWTITHHQEPEVEMGECIMLSVNNGKIEFLTIFNKDNEDLAVDIVHSIPKDTYICQPLGGTEETFLYTTDRKEALNFAKNWCSII